ncbi:MAG TPA: helicase-associated domain-containing protein [Jatrophihabitans sp.]
MHASEPVTDGHLPDTLSGWLRERTDVQLGELLRRRPDLAVPAPADLTTLASRIGIRTSVQRVVDGLDAFHLAVLEAVVVSDAQRPPVALMTVTELLGVAADEQASAAVDELLALTLLWGDHDHLRPVASVAETLGGARSFRDTVSPRPPQIAIREYAPAELDQLGTTAVLETLRLVEALCAEWTVTPPALLRSGGLSVRDLRRVAKALQVDDVTAALYAEVTYAAGLVNSGNGVEPTYLPTEDYDKWLAAPSAARWTRLAAAWLSMSRQPNLVGQRGERDRTLTALSPDVDRGNAATLRAGALDVLSSLPPGAAPTNRDEVLALLSWHAPRRSAAQRGFAEAALREADLLGVTAAGGLTGYSRTLRAGSREVAEQVLGTALPVPVGEFLLQPDLTAVVPGPPTAELARELGLVADLESSGGASVFRITEATIRRALDAGRSATQLRVFFGLTSRTPVPQSLDYLITDSARRHGTLRAGMAETYLRSEDVALLDRLVADRGAAAAQLRRLAPTVLISPLPLARVLELIRAAGYSPAAESGDGSVVSLTFDPPRAPSRPPVRTFASRMASLDSTTQRLDLVKRIRSGDALTELSRRVQPLAQQVPGVTSAATMGLLRTAIREGQRVLVGIAETDGTARRHTILPISMAGGFVRGHDDETQSLRSIPLHRITGVALVDEVPE